MQFAASAGTTGAAPGPVQVLSAAPSSLGSFA